MPIYQYQCVDCGHQMEALQKMSDPKLTDCPACGASSLQKQVTAAAFKLKGTGWYETDFKNSGAKPKASQPTSDADTNNHKSASTDKSSSIASTASSD